MAFNFCPNYRRSTKGPAGCSGKTDLSEPENFSNSAAATRYKLPGEVADPGNVDILLRAFYLLKYNDNLDAVRG